MSDHPWSRQQSASNLLRRSLTLLCCMLGIYLAMAAPNACAVQQATPGKVTMSGWYLEDDERRPQTVESALKTLRDGAGAAMSGGRFNRGNSESLFWIYLQVRNDGSSDQRLLLDTGVPFRAGLTVYLVRGDAVPAGADVILDTDEGMPFSARASTALILHSKDFVVPASGGVGLLLKYTTRGSTFMPLTLKTPEQFDREQRAQLLGSVFYYTVCALLLVVFLVLGTVLRVFTIQLYAGLFALMMVLLLALEGYAFQFLWPNSPGWNQYAGLVLLLVTVGYGFIVARYAMDPASLSAWLKRALMTLATLSLCLAAGALLLPFSPLLEFAGLLMLLAYLAQLRTIASWVATSVKLHLISLAAMLVVFPCVIALTAMAVLDYHIPDLVFLYGNRAIFLFTILTTLMSLSIYVLTLRREHERSMQEALDSARRDAQLNAALLHSEQNYLRARQLAQQSRQQLASTSHDIRQPLASLRAVVHTLGLSEDTREHATLVRALDYIENLSKPTEQQEEDQQAVLRDIENGELRDTNEPYRADLLLQTLSHMFEGEARQKGLALHTVPCSVRIDHPPLALMRILANFTANAIKHCDSGTVVLGCRRKHDALRFDVLDSGPGIDKAEIAQLQLPGHKGESSDGEGLGLAICWQLAAEHGFTIEVQSNAGRGSRFSVSVTTD
ncbi:MAG: hypothetical protein Hals2KO_27330 [Halioglobus sp.]